MRSVLAMVAVSVGGALPAAQSPSVKDLVVRADTTPARVEFEIAWPNGWHNERNRDGAWLVLRGDDARRGPLRLAVSGHFVVASDPAGEVIVGEDSRGAFVAPAIAHRGDVSWRVSLALDEAPPDRVTAWAVGVVQIPGGSFEAGDDHPIALRLSALHTVDDTGAAIGPLTITSEAALAVARRPGALWYHGGRYGGDQDGPIPEAWPKGTRAFWMMKHELTQGQYAAFLNALPAEWQQRRAPTNLEGKGVETCAIARDGDRFVAAAPTRPCNFVSWDDTCAFFDWLSLRPMTELEFEKAARGPRRPVPLDYPWGSARFEELERHVLPTRDLSQESSAPSDESKTQLGASFYWVMDLAGSLWERVVSAGHPTGRAFAASHGDGVLAADGDADQPDWPRGDESGGEAPGIGYRGGAEYFVPREPENPTNPQSPVALRTYGSWAGSFRSETYSARGVRTAPSSVRSPPRAPTAAEAEALRLELLQRVKRDQAVREIDFGKLSDEQHRRFADEAGRVDGENTARLIEIVDAFGWPTTAMIGSEAANAAFLIVQHADHRPDFQSRCLPLIEAAAGRGEASKSAAAYLTDRVRVKQRRPQVYGTQYQGISVDGHIVHVLPIVEAVDRLDERRAAMGLGPWLDYERRMAELQKRAPGERPHAWNGELPVDHQARR